MEFRQQQSVPLDAKSPKVQPYDAKAKVTAASPTSAAAPHDVIAFGGSAGGALLTLALPAIVYLVVISCDKVIAILGTIVYCPQFSNRHSKGYAVCSTTTLKSDYETEV